MVGLAPLAFIFAAWLHFPTLAATVALFSFVFLVDLAVTDQCGKIERRRAADRRPRSVWVTRALTERSLTNELLTAALSNISVSRFSTRRFRSCTRTIIMGGQLSHPCIMLVLIPF